MKAALKTGWKERQNVVATLHGICCTVESSGLDVHFRVWMDVMKLVFYGIICSNTKQESTQMPISVPCSWRME